MSLELKRFLHDHPELKKVAGDPEERVLMWAQELGYISMDIFEGEYYYSEQEYSEAVMWSEKTEQMPTRHGVAHC